MDEIVECPIGGCDYCGLPQSVEAHISGKRDEAHKGEWGLVHRAQLYNSSEQKPQHLRELGV